MTVLPIATVGHPVLRVPAGEISAEELRAPGTQRLIDDMIETMRAAAGVGLAENQVYSLERIAVIEVPEGGNPRYPYKPPIPLTVMVNPVLEPVGDETVEINEGCLSVPDLRGTVDRLVAVRVGS
jgi:peptide deformylase